MTISVTFDVLILAATIQAIGSITGPCLAAVIAYKLTQKRQKKTGR